MSHGIRPSRRDLILVLLTLSFSYLLFSSPSSSGQPIPPPTRSSSSTTPSRYRLSDWSQIWRSNSAAASAACAADDLGAVREKTFGESVQTFGVARSSIAEGPDELDEGSRGEFWDGGEESAEDDELEAISTVLKGYQPGWTMFERLYVYNGSFYVVT